MKQPPTVSFRADAGVTLGGGHVMRCLALATEMRRRGWVVHFATGPETAAVVPALGRAGIAVRVVGTAGELESAQATEVDLAVFDHYALDETAERRARRWARRIMVIDDLANRRHDADVLLDGTLDRRAEDYRGLVTDDCRLLLGPDYALVRPRFAAARRHRRVAPGASPCILVSLGATDPERVAEAVLAGLARHAGRLAVTVVTGAATEHLAAIRAAAAASPHAVDVRVDVTDMAALMAAADLAIGGAGTSAWERCCVGLPSLVIELADNQRGTAAALHRHGAARNLGPASGLDSGKVGTAVHELLADTGGWRRMANAASRVCDGRGVARTLAALAAPVLAGAARVTLRAAEGSDAPRMLAWQRHPATRRYARNRRPPSESEHHHWITDRLSDPGCLLNLVLRDCEPAGVLRLDALTEDPLAYEVSILTAPEYHRRGIGGAALALARALVPGARLKAVVLPGNRASQALFTAAGYLGGADDAWWSEPTPATPGAPERSREHARERSHA